MSKHFRDHPQIKSYYGHVGGGRRETHTRLQPSSEIPKHVADLDGGPSAITDTAHDTLAEPPPSGGRRVIPDGQRIEDIEAFEDPDGARYRDEH